VVGRITGKRQRPDPATFAGKGKVGRSGRARRTPRPSSDLRPPLSGVQQRNLEQQLGCRVVDRTSLILDIFAQRRAAAKASCRSSSPS